MPPSIDDRAFRAAAKRLLLRGGRCRRSTWRRRWWSASAAFSSEVVTMDRDGPLRSAIVLDLGGPEQTVLAEVNGR